MKIIHIIPTLKKGGAERLVTNICYELSKRPNIEVLLISLSTENEFQATTQKINYKAIPSKAIPSILKKPKVEIDQLISVIKSFNPDIIHSHLFEAEMISRWHLFKQVKYFSHSHDNMIQLKNISLSGLTRKSTFTNFYEKSILIKKYIQTNNQFIAISKDTAAYLKKSLPNSLSDNIHLLHNAIDLQHFRKHSLEQKLNKIKIINVGSFIPLKNQKLLIDIAKMLRNKSIDFEITMLGDGPLYNQIKEDITNYNLTPFINIPGNVDNVGDYYSKANIYVHTSKSEAFGLVLIEAMASGLPVVTLDGGGNKDLIEEGKNGFMIHKNDANLFVTKILQIMDDKSLYQNMSDYAYSFSRKFNIETYVDKLLKLYEA